MKRSEVNINYWEVSLSGHRLPYFKSFLTALKKDGLFARVDFMLPHEQFESFPRFDAAFEKIKGNQFPEFRIVPYEANSLDTFNTSPIAGQVRVNIIPQADNQISKILASAKKFNDYFIPIIFAPVIHYIRHPSVIKTPLKFAKKCFYQYRNYSSLQNCGGRISTLQIDLSGAKFYESNFHIKPLSEQLQKDQALKRSRLTTPKNVTSKKILLIGGISARKNSINFLQSLKFLGENKIPLHVTIAGPIESDIQHQINEAISVYADCSDITVELHNYTLTDEEVVDRIIETDLIFAAYKNFYGPSAIFNTACQYDKKIVVSQKNTSGINAKQYSLAFACDPDRVSSIADALHKALFSDRKAISKPAWFPYFLRSTYGEGLVEATRKIVGLELRRLDDE